MSRIILFLIFLFQFLVVELKSQIITTIVGTGVAGYSGDGMSATAARIRQFSGISISGFGDIYISDGVNHRVRKVDFSTGIINTVAGTGTSGYTGDGLLAITANFSLPVGAILDKYGNTFIMDANNYRIRKIDIITGIVKTIAGNGIFGYSGDGGPATSASIYGGYIAIDDTGNLYIADGRRIRKVDTFGIINTIAGTGSSGITYDGVSAISANINPIGIGIDENGNVYFSDTTRSIRKIDAVTGIVNRIGGTGDNIASSYSGDGIATSCHIGAHGIAVARNGDVYIADHANSRIEVIYAASGTIISIAGTGEEGYFGDGGLATNCKLYSPSGVALDLCGNVYVADGWNYVARKITMPPILTIPTISLAVTEAGTVMPVGSTVTVNATVANAGSSYLIRWQNRGVEFATTTVPIVTYTKMPGVDTITARVVSTASYGCYDSTTSAPQYVSDSSTGVTGAEVMGGVYVYPNPAHKQVTIMAGERMHSVAISNMQGQELLRYAPNATSYTVAIDMLAPGVYIVRVNDVWVGKVVKE